MQRSKQTIGEFLQSVHPTQRETVLVNLYRRIKPYDEEQERDIPGFFKARELIRIGTVAELLGKSRNKDILPLEEEIAGAHYEVLQEGFMTQNQLTGYTMITIAD